MRKSFIYFFVLTTVLNLIRVGSYAQNSKIDSLSTFIKTAKSDTIKIKTLNVLCTEYRIIGEMDNAILKGNEGLKLSRELQWKKGEAEILTNIGIIHWSQGNYSLALNNYSEALKINELLGDENKIANSLGNIGLVYWNQGEYPKALSFYFKALQLNEKTNNKEAQAKNIANIGNVYWNQGDLDQALNYYFKALKIAEETNDKNGICIDLGNIGLVYWNKGNYDQALEYYFKALKLAEKLNSKSLISAWKSNIGNAYNSQKKYDQALEFYFASLKLDEELGDQVGVATTLGNVGVLYFEQKKYSESKTSLLKALNVSTTIGATYIQKDHHQSLSKLYSETNNFELALMHYRTYISLNDNLTNEENTKKTVQSQMQYEFDKKEAVTKAEQDKKDSIDSKEKQKQQIIIYAISAGFLLMLILAGVIFRSLKLNKQKNKLISHQKAIVEEKQKEIIDSIHYAKRIQQSLLPTEKYISQNLIRLRKK